MIKPAATSFFELAAARHGHFQLESGHHSELWFNLDALFAVPRRIDPFVKQLAESLRSYEVAAVCGPLLGGAFLAQLVAHALDVDFCFTERVMPRVVCTRPAIFYRKPSALACAAGESRWLMT